jgi:hypothetical protein
MSQVSLFETCLHQQLLFSSLMYTMPKESIQFQNTDLPPRLFFDTILAKLFPWLDSHLYDSLHPPPPTQVDQYFH